MIINIIAKINAKIAKLQPKAEWTNGSFSNMQFAKGKRPSKKHVAANRAAREICELEQAIKTIASL